MPLFLCNKKGLIMNISCGTDIIEINRIEKAIENSEERFLTKVFTKKEIEYCESKHKVKYQHYAARFAAKEAVYKALNNIIEGSCSISWQNIEIINNEKGKPEVSLKNINLENIISIDISLSHCKEYAIANAVVLYNKN